MRWQANACRTFSGGSAAGACATRTGSTALGAGQRSANVSARASVAVQIAATVRTARLAITDVSYRLPREETVDLGVLSPRRLRPADVPRRKHLDAGMHVVDDDIVIFGRTRNNRRPFTHTQLPLYDQWLHRRLWVRDRHFVQS